MSELGEPTIVSRMVATVGTGVTSMMDQRGWTVEGLTSVLFYSDYSTRHDHEFTFTSKRNSLICVSVYIPADSDGITLSLPC